MIGHSVAETVFVRFQTREERSAQDIRGQTDAVATTTARLSAALTRDVTTRARLLPGPSTNGFPGQHAPCSALRSGRKCGGIPSTFVAHVGSQTAWRIAMYLRCSVCRILIKIADGFSPWRIREPYSCASSNVAVRRDLPERGLARASRAAPVASPVSEPRQLRL